MVVTTTVTRLTIALLRMYTISPWPPSLRGRSTARYVSRLVSSSQVGRKPAGFWSSFSTGLNDSPTM